MYLTYRSTANLNKHNEIEINYSTTIGHKTLEEVTQLADKDAPKFYIYEGSMHCRLYIMFRVDNPLKENYQITGAVYMVLSTYRSHVVIPLDEMDDRLPRDKFAQKYYQILKKYLHENYRRTALTPYFETLKE